MINVTINNIDYSIKNSIEEFTIAEFETISGFLNDENLDKIDKYSKIFLYLGIPENSIDEMEPTEFFELIKKFIENQNEIDLVITEKIKEIEINGRIYQSYEGEGFKMNVKQMKHIEKYVKLNSTAYIGDLMAIIFKDVELTANEHYVDAHLRHKAKLFRENVTVDKALPFVGFFSKELLTNFQTYGNA